MISAARAPPAATDACGWLLRSAPGSARTASVLAPTGNGGSVLETGTAARRPLTPGLGTPQWSGSGTWGVEVGTTTVPVGPTA